MSFDKIVVIILVLTVGSFFAMRIILSSIGELYLSKNEKKRRKKGRTFKEWLLFSRYYNEIPKPIINLYYIVLISHLLFLGVTLIALSIEQIQEILSNMVLVLTVFDLLWLSVISLISWKPGERLMNYKQWVPKPKSKKK